MNTASLILLIGTFTVIVSILTKLIGLPDQIRQNYIRKSTEGVSTILIVLLCLSYILWTIYGFLKKDIFLMVGHGVGIISTGIIVLQILKYRSP